MLRETRAVTMPLLTPAWVGVLLLSSALLLAGFAEESWYGVLSQASVRILTADDFAALLLLAWLLVLQLAIGGEARVAGLLPWTSLRRDATEWRLAPVVLSLLPVNLGLILLSLLSGLRIAEVWAAAWLPMVLFCVAGAPALAADIRMWRQSAGPSFLDRVQLLLVPGAVLAAIGLVLLGYARPIEGAALALLGVVAVLSLLLGPISALVQLRKASGLAACWMAALSLWLLAGTWWYLGWGLTGAQAFIFDQLRGSGIPPAALAALVYISVVAIGQLFRPFAVLLVTAPLLLPCLFAGGFGLDWSVVFLALAAGHAGVLARTSGLSAGSAPALVLPAIAAIVFLAWPELVMSSARGLRFW